MLAWATVIVVGAMPGSPDLSTESAAATVAGQTVGVPAYFYPAGDNLPLWERLRQSAPAVSTVIATGLRLEGPAPDTNYQAQIRATSLAGVRVLAYVTTSGGLKPPAQVKAEIDKAYSWYAIGGIFFDESVAYPVTCDQVPYYTDLNQFVKSKRAGALTVVNHGQILPECYAGVSDVMMNAEMEYTAYKAGWQPWGWEHKYPASKFWHLVHSAPNVTAMRDAIQLSSARNAGRVFVTSATMSSPGGPYGTLPSDSYWAAELSAATASAPTTTTTAPGRSTTTTTVKPTTTTVSPTTTSTMARSAPSVTGFSPTSGPVRSKVTIVGTGFTGVNLVTLDGGPVRIVSVTDTKLVVTLNSWNTTGRFYVSKPGGQSTLSTGSFTVVR